jgi:hypothetical protein
MAAMKAACLAVVLVAVAAPAVAGSNDPKAIDAQCASAAKHKERARIFADVSGAVRPGPSDHDGNWRLFKDADELKAYEAKQGAPNTEATVWSAPDGTTIALMHFTSKASDWGEDVDYCFRPDGTLSRAISAMVNFEEELYGHRNLYYAPDGAVVSKKERASENGSRRKGPDMMDGFPTTIIYPRVQTLPFTAADGSAALPKKTPQ